MFKKQPGENATSLSCFSLWTLFIPVGGSHIEETEILVKKFEQTTKKFMPCLITPTIQSNGVLYYFFRVTLKVFRRFFCLNCSENSKISLTRDKAPVRRIRNLHSTTSILVPFIRVDTGLPLSGRQASIRELIAPSLTRASIVI